MISALLAVLFTMGCGNGQRHGQSEAATKLLEAAQKAKNYQYIITLADSLEQTNDLSLTNANYWRGYACERMKKMRMAEFYWKTSVGDAEHSDNSEDVATYAKAASRMANLLCVRGDYEGALKMAVPVVERLNALGCDSTADYINLLIYIGCCQSGLNNAETEAFDGFEMAYQKHLDNIKKNRNDAAFKNAIAGLINISYYCLVTEQYKEAVKWIDNYGKLLTEYEQLPEADAEYVDKQLARFDISKAKALVGLKDTVEAAKLYESFLTTRYSQTPEGRINANGYLVDAGRWDEAATNYRSLDALLEQQGPLTLENIQAMLLKKYQANLRAGRRDSAAAVSMFICDSLDHALTAATKMETSELTTITARTEQFTAQKAEQDRRGKLIFNVVVVTVTLLLLLLAVALYRKLRKTQEEVQSQQQTDQDTIEDARNEGRIETALHLAKELKTTALPPSLPQHDALTLYASSTSADTMSGSRYDLQLRDNQLYMFHCDAPENDMRSQILLTLALTQFRTAVSQGASPAAIMGLINEALLGTFEEDRGLLLFVGMLDLTTGILTYSNAGHTAPLVVGTEIVKLSVNANTPVGLDPDATFSTQQQTLDEGSMLFIYNVGVTTIENADKKQYGERRLLGDALQAMKTDPAPKPFVGSILAAVNRFIDTTPPTEDVVFLAIRYK